MDKINVTDNAFLRQFETEVQGELATKSSKLSIH